MNGPTFALQPTTASKPVPRPMPLRVAERPKSDAGAGGMMVFTYLRLHWMMILFCGTLLGAGLAYTAWNLLPNKFESYALLQVASTPSSIAPGNDPNRGKTEFVTYLKTTAQLIKSEFVLNAALNDAKYKIGELATLKDQKDPIKFLDEKLVVTSSDGGSELIRISLEGDNPDDIRKIVDAVKDAYYREVVEKEIQQKSTFRLKVAEAKTAIESLLRIKGALPDRSKPGFATKTPTPLAGGVINAAAIDPANLPPPTVEAVKQVGGILPIPPAAIGAAVVAIADSDAVKKAQFSTYVSQLSQYKLDSVKFPIMIREKLADVEKLKKQLNEANAVAPSAEALAAAERDADVIAKLAEAGKKRRDYEYMRGVVRDPSSEAIQRKRIEADQLDAEALKLKTEKASQLEGGRSRDQSNRIATDLDARERELRLLYESQRVAKTMFDEARKELSQMPPDAKSLEEKLPLVDPEKTDLLMHDDMYRRITTQLIGLDFELQAPPRVRKLQDASSPSQKDAKKQLMGTIAAALLGFALIGLGVVAYETRARKVSSLTELKSVGTTPVVGIVPWQPDAATIRDPLKRADVNEAIEKLRSHVAQTWLSRGVSTIAVTSPLADEGKAFTAFGLAVSLSLAGFKTLLIDFDLRNPSLHPFAGVPNVVGVCEILRGEVDPRGSQIVLPNGLSFLPAGNWSDEARQATIGGKLEMLLSKLRENFDCLILHGHSLLTVADSIEIVRRSDAVLLCTLYRETRMPLLKRAIERVTTMEVPHTGIVYLGASSNEALC